MTRLRLGAILLLLALPSFSSAQSPPGDSIRVGGIAVSGIDVSGIVVSGIVVSGVVHSEDSVPVPSASVALHRSADSVAVAASITAADGVFQIEEVAAGEYLMEVSHLGHRTSIRSVTITGSTARVDLGIILLEPRAIPLAEVEVTAARASVSMLSDRNVYQTADMPAAVGGTATDVLRGVPELEVDIDGGVTARGTTPSIHINGRPAPMQGGALNQYLQQLPAERIDRIEVIPNPSARHEAEGQGGIVNIVMKRGVSFGLSGNLALNAGTGNDRGGSGSINYQEGILTLFGSASVSFFSNDSESSDLRQNLTTRPSSYIQQDSRNRDSGGFGSLDVGAEVKAGSRGTFWTDLGIGRSASETEVLASYAHLDHFRNPTQRYDRSDDRDLRRRFGSFVAGYGHIADARKREWSVELRRNFNGGDETSESAILWLSQEGEAVDLPPELASADDGQGQNNLSLDANLMRGWGESGQLEVGYRGSWRSNRNDFQKQVDAAGNPGSRDESVADFRHRERIHAAFLTVQRQIGRFAVQLGVRGEQAEIRAALPLVEDTTFESRYRNLFPSANISTAFGAGGQLRLSYSKRLDRPRAEILNPVSLTLDPLNRQVGNPYLMPRFTHSLTLTASRTGTLGSLQLSPFYRRTVDSWDQVRTVDEAGVSTVTWQNLGTIRTYGGGITASLAQLGPLGGFVSVRGYREVREASERAEFSGSSTRYSVISNLNVAATSTLSLQGMLTYLPPRELPQGTMSSMVFSTLGVRQEFGDGRGSINLSVVDPFALQRFSFTTRDGTHVQIGNSTFSARRWTLGISYSFGRPPESNRPRNTPEEDQEDRQPRIR